MNDTSTVARSGGSGSIAGVETARVGALEHHDPRILAERPRQLSVADVDRDHAARAAAQQAVGEAAGRGADVERHACRRRRCAKASSAPASFSPPRLT